MAQLSIKPLRTLKYDLLCVKKNECHRLLAIRFRTHSNKCHIVKGKFS